MWLRDTGIKFPVFHRKKGQGEERGKGGDFS